MSSFVVVRITSSPPPRWRGAVTLGPLRTLRAVEIEREAEGPDWLIESLWPHSAVGIVGGQPKAFKTWLTAFDTAEAAFEHALSEFLHDLSIFNDAMSRAAAAIDRMGARGKEHARTGAGLLAECVVGLGLVKLAKLAGACRLGAAGAEKVDKWRRHARNLHEQLAMAEARSGRGSLRIRNLGDARFRGMEKWHHTHVGPDGKPIVVHYVRDPKTNRLMDFKFKAPD